MKKLLLIFLLLAVMGCQNTDYNYVLRDDYKVSVKDSNFQVKKALNKSYYKAVGSTGNYLVLERNLDTREVDALLNVEYRGENWIYLEGVEFTSESGVEDINFVSKKFKGALVEEESKSTNSVIENIAFKVTEEQVLGLEEVLKSSDVDVRYYSRYKDRSATRKLTAEEIRNFRLMIELYKKV